VLYDGGCRTDAWYFTPAPARTEGKLLTPLRIAAIGGTGPGEITIQVHGVMQRPGGAWWDRTAELVFSASGRALQFARVGSGTFTSRDYERDGQEPRTVSVKTERLVQWKGRLVREVRSSEEPADEDCERASGGSEPRSGVTTGTACVTATSKPRVERRPADAPTFIERGGR
jgi:hypothetical protein